MKYTLFAATIFILAGCSSNQSGAANTPMMTKPLANSSLTDVKWNYGSIDCTQGTEPAIHVHRANETSYILRQSKCVNFEAPFIYVLFGQDKVVVFDTGATESTDEFPLYKTVRSLMDEQSARDGITDREILVLHSHSHSDHYTGDVQFYGQQKVTVIDTQAASVNQLFALSDDRTGLSSIELGARRLTLIRTPGHQEEAITVYDAQTQWLLTGDSFYPGIVYVKDWQAYRKSISTLASFVTKNNVSAVLGAHIEMTQEPGKYYAIGTTYQPNEAPLPLAAEHIIQLNNTLQNMEEPKDMLFDRFAIVPMNILQKTLSNIARWFTQ